MSVETKARMTLFHSEVSSEPVNTFWKLRSEKWGHSIAQLAFESIEASSSQSMGTRKRSPSAPSRVFPVTFFTVLDEVARFSGGSSSTVPSESVMVATT